jgi:hypothetical protein
MKPSARPWRTSRVLDVLQEVVGDEVVPYLPEQVGQEDGERQGHSAPEPWGEKIAAGAGEQHCAEDAGDEEDDRVFGLKSQSKYSANGQPPSRIVALQQPNHEVGGKDPPEIVEGGVLEFCALEERQRRERDSKRGGDLSQAPAAQFAGHQAGDDNGPGLGEDGKEPQADERGAEQRHADVFDKGRKGRIGHESPVEMAGVGEELEFVAVEAVAAVGEQMQQGDGGRDADE